MRVAHLDGRPDCQVLGWDSFKYNIVAHRLEQSAFAPVCFGAPRSRYSSSHALHPRFAKIEDRQFWSEYHNITKNGLKKC